MVVKAFAAATIEAFRARGVTHVGLVPETVPVIHDAARKTPQKRHGKTGRFVSFSPRASSYKQRKAEKAYKLLRELQEVNVMTAGDDHVCQQCEDIADQGPYELDTALSLVPAHVNCRCVFVPLGPLPMEDAL